MPNHRVTLHVYHLGQVTGFLNQVLRGQGLGLFHCGVEVLGVEWSFHGIKGLEAGDATTGVTGREPRTHPRHIYEESIDLGNTPLRKKQIAHLIHDLTREWLAITYSVIGHNCVDFAEALASLLQVPTPFPAWVHGAAKGSSITVGYATVAGALGGVNLFSSLASCYHYDNESDQCCCGSDRASSCPRPRFRSCYNEAYSQPSNYSDGSSLDFATLASQGLPEVENWEAVPPEVL